MSSFTNAPDPKSWTSPCELLVMNASWLHETIWRLHPEDHLFHKCGRDICHSEELRRGGLDFYVLYALQYYIEYNDV